MVFLFLFVLIAIHRMGLSVVHREIFELKDDRTRKRKQPEINEHKNMISFLNGYNKNL